MNEGATIGKLKAELLGGILVNQGYGRGYQSRVVNAITHIKKAYDYHNNKNYTIDDIQTVVTRVFVNLPLASHIVSKIVPSYSFVIARSLYS